MSDVQQIKDAALGLATHYLARAAGPPPGCKAEPDDFNTDFEYGVCLAVAWGEFLADEAVAGRKVDAAFYANPLPRVDDEDTSDPDYDYGHGYDYDYDDDDDDSEYAGEED